MSTGVNICCYFMYSMLMDVICRVKLNEHKHFASHTFSFILPCHGNCANSDVTTRILLLVRAALWYRITASGLSDKTDPSHCLKNSLNND